MSAPTAGIDQKILDRVRALMAKAEGTDFPAEAETYAAKAAELMARYGVEQAMLAGSDPTVDPIESKEMELLNPYVMTKAALLHEVAVGMSCSMCYRVERDGMKVAILYGHRTDIERVEFLYTSLIVQAFRMVMNVRPDFSSAAGVSAFRRSWLLGFTNRISERLKAATATAVAESSRPGAELVLVDRRSEVERAFRAANPRMRTRSVGYTSGAGYAAGHAAGGRADLGQARMRGGRAAIAQ